MKRCGMRDGKKVPMKKKVEKQPVDKRGKGIVLSGESESCQGAIRWIRDKMSNVKDFGALSILYYDTMCVCNVKLADFCYMFYVI